MRTDQIAESRRALKQMNDAADRAIDHHVARSQAGPTDHVEAMRRTSRELEDAINRAADQQGLACLLPSADGPF